MLCGTTENTFKDLNITSANPQGIYRARIYIGSDMSCVKDTFFSVTKAPQQNTNIPDSNIFVVVLTVLIAAFALSKKRI